MIPNNIKCFLRLIKQTNINVAGMTGELILFFMFSFLIDIALFFSSSFVVFVVNILLTLFTLFLWIVCPSYQEKILIKDIYLFVEIPLTFLTLILAQLQATISFRLFVLLFCIAVALAQFLFIKKRIKKGLHPKDSKISGSVVALSAVASTFGIFLGKMTSLIAGEGAVDILALFVSMFLAAVLIPIAVLKLIAVYYFRKYRAYLSELEENTELPKKQK